MADHPELSRALDPDESRFTAIIVPEVEPATVVVSGELDFCTVEKLRGVLQRCRRAGERHLVLEVSGLEFLSATGVSALAEHHAWASSGGGSFVLTNPRPAVRRVLTLTGHAHLVSIATPTPRRSDPHQH